ncbi:MAG TPA: PQQ-dependent sugar dehydrogenase [Ilumatobacteraceae bacterium]|nr:PQQ-dependent sugar dehydrogenase [Ilumatobacteraceae bacterium]
MSVATGCGSDSPPQTDESFGAGPSATRETTGTTTGTTAGTTAAGETTAAPESTGPTESSGATTPSTAPAPLPVPAVSLYDVGTFDQPVQVTNRPGDSVVYVVEQPGRVVAVTDLSSEVVLDISDLTNADGEQGLLGLAFHPTGDLAYVNYTDTSGDTVVAEFAIDPATSMFDPASRREVLTVDQPYSNHNGGQLAFGPDQLLYIGLGDGGSGGDPQRYALDLESRLGKILRIDPVVSADQPFTVPADNPFVDTAGADPTIWAYGLRNPWRFSFDAPTGDLWIADVGQGDWEEVNRALATTDRMNAGRGANFGWSAIEGFEPFNRDQPSDGALDPWFVYDHNDGRCSVSGGAVARGESIPDLQGWYVFGDYCTGQIWALDPTVPASEPRVLEIARLGGLAAIAHGPDGDLYAVSNAGTVARLVPA